MVYFKPVRDDAGPEVPATQSTPGHPPFYRHFYTFEGADKILDYYRASKGAFLCIQKNKRILHYGYIIKQSL